MYVIDWRKLVGQQKLKSTDMIFGNLLTDTPYFNSL